VQLVAAVGNVSAQMVARETTHVAAIAPMLWFCVPAASVPVLMRPLVSGTGCVPNRPGRGMKAFPTLMGDSC
jgi:hypothetical protein